MDPVKTMVDDGRMAVQGVFVPTHATFARHIAQRACSDLNVMGSFAMAAHRSLFDHTVSREELPKYQLDLR